MNVVLLGSAHNIPPEYSISVQYVHNTCTQGEVLVTQY